MQKDTLFAKPIENLGDWTFDDKVADVFPDMLVRSIPGYDSIQMLIGMLTRRFAQPNSNLYDLGCSLGQVTLSLRRNIQVPNCRIIAVDNSAAMTARCQRNINAFRSPIPVEVHCQDICHTTITQASIVVLNFTLQFIAPELRQQLINTIYKGMVAGAILILSEKWRFADDKIDNLIVAMHHNFKKSNGYSELEISQKRSMLENVMKTDTCAGHYQRLTTAGFTQMTTLFQCLNFGSIIAIKTKQ